MLQMEIIMEQKDSWVIEVESSLEAEIRAEEFPDGVIHTVPKSLLSSECKVFYHPQVISLGPYHFQKKEKLDDEIELLKSGAARYVHHQIKDGLKSSEKVTYVNSESGLKSVMESFKDNEEGIKKSYADKGEFKVTGEACAWMMARDACFVLQVLQNFREDAEKSGTASVDHILSRDLHHPLLPEIVKDMLKMENQLPFWVLKEIRTDIEGWYEEALKNLSPIEVANVGNKREYKGNHHILQLLHDYILDSQHSPASSDRQSGSSLGKISENALKSIRILFHTCFYKYRPFNGRLYFFNKACLKDWRNFFSRDEMSCFLCLCCCYPLRFLIVFVVCGFCEILFVYIIWPFVSVIVLLALSPVIIILFIIFTIANPRPPKWKIQKHASTVEELRRLGVNFKKLEGKKLGISHIEFKEMTSTLYLPQFKVDNKSEVILRNLIASGKTEKPITRYAVLMNDLINTSEDVAVLRGQDIITSNLGSDEETAQLWNSMVTSTEVPSYSSIDESVSSMEKYCNKWWKVLWAQFIMTHCSKPWLVLSLLAGLLLLLLTVTQVVCLFASCQIK